MLRSFETALAFLTVFRVRMDPRPEMEEVGRSVWAFPIVGALMGLILVVARHVCNGHLPEVLQAVLVVGLWIVLTGALHLDGWTDCCDAIAASVPSEERLRILKDPRLGTFGATGLILLLAVKTATVANGEMSYMMLFLAPVVGRGSMVLARGAKHIGIGMAAGFIRGLDDRSVTGAALLVLVPAVIAGWTGIVSVVAAYAVAVGFRRLAESRLNAVNGDVIGSMCELSEAVVLVIAFVRW